MVFLYIVASYLLFVSIYTIDHESPWVNNRPLSCIPSISCYWSFRRHFGWIVRRRGRYRYRACIVLRVSRVWRFTRICHEYSDSYITGYDHTDFNQLYPLSSKKDNVDFTLLKLLAPFVFLGVLLGSWLMTRIDGALLSLLFGVIATLSALNMILRTGKSALCVPSMGETQKRFKSSVYKWTPKNKWNC